MVGRGPQRIWLAHPASAGCAVMEDLAITSSVSAAVAFCWSWSGCCSRVWFGARKMVEEDGAQSVGRRVGRWEKVLRGCISASVLRWGEDFGGSSYRALPAFAVVAVAGAQRGMSWAVGRRSAAWSSGDWRLTRDILAEFLILFTLLAGRLGSLSCRRGAPPSGQSPSKVLVRFGSEVAVPSESSKPSTPGSSLGANCQHNPPVLIDQG